MAESGNFSETASYENAPRRRNFHQNRPPYSPRGRGRTDPHVMKALHNFGVRDLRELLDRKHQDEQDQEEQQPIVPRGRGRYIGPSEHSFIQNPINIKVELMTATGERNYSLSQDAKLLDIKHIPDHDEQAHELDWGRGRSNRSVTGLERGRGVSSYRDRGSSYRGRGLLDRGRYKIEMINNEADWCRNESSRGRMDIHRGRHETGRGRGRYETNRGNETDWCTSDSDREIYETAKGRDHSDASRYERSKGRQESDLDISEPERGRRYRGTNNPNRGRHELARGRYNSNRGRYETDSGKQGTDWNRGESETDWDESETERGGRVSERGRSEYRRGRGRDSRGRSESMRAKSIERVRTSQFETENREHRVRDAKVRSRSAETRGDNDTKEGDGGAKGRGRGGRGRSMNRGRGRGDRKSGRNKEEQRDMTNDMNNAPSDNVGINNQDNWDDEASGNKAEVELGLSKTDDETTGVQGNDFDDALEENYGVSGWLNEKYDEKYADEAEKEAEEEIKDGQTKIHENKENIVEIKENLIITSNDHKQKKRTVRFDLGEGKRDNKTAESIENQLAALELGENHGIEKLTLESSSSS